jgi:hypothetical protein
MDAPDYTREEERRILDAVRDGGPVPCPRCGHPLEPRDVAPMKDVAYVRRRLWLHCATCRRGIVVDRPR